MGVVYLAYCGSWQLYLHVPYFCAFYIFNTTPNPTSSSFFQNVFVLVYITSTCRVSIYMVWPKLLAVFTLAYQNHSTYHCYAPSSPLDGAFGTATIQRRLHMNH